MRPALLALSLCVACGDPGIATTDKGGDDTGPAADDTGTADTGPPPPVDADGDGFDEDADCDDGDAAVHPGATEAWNGVDDDCDGRRDGDGYYTGAVAVDASAVYEGHTYPFALTCPGALERDGGTITLRVTCTPDPTDDMAQLLLGETLVISLDEELDPAAVGDDAWTGRLTLRSSDGWDTWADADLTWVAFSGVALSVDRSTVSLVMAASGTLLYEAEPG